MLLRSLVVVAVLGAAALTESVYATFQAAAAGTVVTTRAAATNGHVRSGGRCLAGTPGGKLERQECRTVTIGGRVELPVAQQRWTVRPILDDLVTVADDDGRCLTGDATRRTAILLRCDGSPGQLWTGRDWRRVTQSDSIQSL